MPLRKGSTSCSRQLECLTCRRLKVVLHVLCIAICPCRRDPKQYTLYKRLRQRLCTADITSSVHLSLSSLGIAAGVRISRTLSVQQFRRSCSQLPTQKPGSQSVERKFCITIKLNKQMSLSLWFPSPWLAFASCFTTPISSSSSSPPSWVLHPHYLDEDFRCLPRTSSCPGQFHGAAPRLRTCQRLYCTLQVSGPSLLCVCAGARCGTGL